jgi:hypothetical protein
MTYDPNDPAWGLAKEEREAGNRAAGANRPRLRVFTGRAEPGSKEGDREEKRESSSFPATPFRAADLANIKQRQWVYGHYLIARFLSVLGAPGGTGKTAYAITVGLSVALGRALLDEPVHCAGPVWIYNLEDPRDEVLRRVHAACIAHGVDPAKLEEGSSLFVDSGRDRPLIVAERTLDGTLVATPLVEELIKALRERAIKLLIVDPCVKSHRLEENKNEQVDFVAALWNRVAEEANCAILLVHHFRKGGTEQSGADSFRGASALIDASRAAVSLSTMTDKEAERSGVDADERRFYVRADNAKANLAPPPKSAVWLHLLPINLPNGDCVQAVRRWMPPSPWADLPHELIIEVLQRIGKGRDNGDLWAPEKRSGEAWAGHVITGNTTLKDIQAADLLAEWERANLLKIEQCTTKARNTRKGYRLDEAEFSKLRQEWSTRDG